MKLSVGYQITDQYEFIDCIIPQKDQIGEVYFPWYGLGDGRGITIQDEQDQKYMETDLAFIHEEGIKLNLLINGNCYGAKALSVELKEKITSAVSRLLNSTGLETVTTTSIFAAKVLREKFPEIDIRASVNMNIRTIRGMEYISDYFDSFYIGRELNRIPKKISEAAQWCHERNKKIFLLANSGCLADCSVHTFHDNLVSHENEIGREENAIPSFTGICWEFLSKPENREAFLTHSTWLRPEEVRLYEGVIDGIKLATRTNRDPKRIINAYTKGHYNGNILALLEPDFSGIRSIENSELPNDRLEIKVPAGNLN